MIPVLGVPVLNGFDHLDRMIASIDADTGIAVIVDNGDVVPADFSESPFCRVIRLPHNIGCGAAWNLVIKVTPEAPWWFFTNHDIIFRPGDLDHMAAIMWSAGEDEKPLICVLHGFSAFALNRRALKAIGWFDENFHPAYFEDNDYTWRAHLAGVAIQGTEGQSQHLGSRTIFENRRYRDRNNTTFDLNSRYYTEKWGGPPGNEAFSRPFNGEKPVELDPDRLKELAWARMA